MKQDQLRDDLHSAIELVLYQPDILSSADTRTIDLYRDGKHQVKLENRSWGAYEILRATTGWRGIIAEKTAVLGGRYPASKLPALYMEDRNEYLSISGHTRLRGDCYLPGAHIKTAYMNRMGYSGDKPVWGNIFRSDQLPTVSAKYQKNNLSYLNFSENSYDSVRLFHEFAAQSQAVSHSFSRKNLVLYSIKPIKLYDHILEGNIRVVSKTGIIVHEESHLKDVILYAPVVHVKQGFSGSLQIFASDSILIEDHCEFLFPSYLGVLNQKESGIQIASHVDIHGGVSLLCISGRHHEASTLSLGKDSRVDGLVYCNSSIEQRGSVYGSVFSGRFVYQSNSITYENHLFNAVIDKQHVSDYLSYPFLFEGLKNKRVIKWVN